MSKQSGKMVQHEDGRIGIMYNSDQREQYFDEGKVIVKWYKDGKLIQTKYKVKEEKLKIIGFVD